MSSKHWIRQLAAPVACLAWIAAGQSAQGEEPRVEVRRMVERAPGHGEEGQRIQVQVVAQEGARSEYWLGLECYPVEGALRAHLNLSEGEGLLIEQVVPDSPAAKAELKQHDVIVKAGDKSVKAVADLMKAVDEAKDGGLSLEVIRGGKTLTIKATPAKRPETQDVLRRVPVQRLEDLRGMIDRLQEAKPGEFRYRILGPGAVVPGEAKKGLPSDLSVSITRQGSEPAKITVKKGDKTWDVTEKEIDKLPDDIRPHVERMLGRNIIALPGMMGGGGAPGLPIVVPQPARPEIRKSEGGTEKQLKEMMEQLEKLRKQMEDLQRSLPKDKPQPKETRA